MRILRPLAILFVASTMTMLGCGDDDSGGGGKGGSSASGGGGSGGGGTGGGGTGGGGTGGTAGSNTGGTAGSNTGGTAGSSTGGTAGSSTGGTAGGGGTAGASAADAFCDLYDKTCGYGKFTPTYNDKPDCVAKFNAYDTARQACVTQHVGLASADAATHCPHAAGAAPCN